MQIYVDDLRPCPTGWILVTNVHEALAHLIKFGVTDLSLDNDLGVPGLENEGREIIRQLVRMQEEDGYAFWPLRTIRIHSANPIAREYMRGMIERYAPFRWSAPDGAFVRVP